MLAALWLAAAQPAVAADVTVEELRVAPTADGTRVVFDLTGPVEHTVFALTAPERVVIDVRRARSGGFLRLSGAAGAVTGFRSGQRDNGELRLVLDLNQAVRPKSSLLPPEGQNGYRLVVDLVAPDRVAVQHAPAALASSPRPLIVAIDAGHGGHDPGAEGSGGTKEKVVVLQIAKRVADEINAQPGLRAFLIRDRDVYIEPTERMPIARRAGADLFLSIHADAVEGNSTVRGATVYAISQRAADDEAAKILRNRSANVMGGVSLADRDPLVASVLVDLSQNAASSASVALGQSLINRLGAVTPIRKSQVQHKSLAVLRAPDMPSLLLEVAYISNARDEALLRSSDYQAKVARSIREGIVDHYVANPPPGSHFATATAPARTATANAATTVTGTAAGARSPAAPPAAPRPAITHVVKRGETLSGIADRYRVSLASLRRANRIANGNVIQVGQRLTIPSS